MTNLTTARTVGAGKVGLTGGAGVIPFAVDSESDYDDILNFDVDVVFINPQGRLDIGLSDAVDLGFQTGLMLVSGAEGFGWLGMLADVKWAVVDDPDSVTLSWGGGVGWMYLGGVLEGHLFLDSNVPFLPFYAAVKPRLTVGAGSGFTYDLSAGIHIEFSDSFRLIGDWTTFAFTLNSFSLGVQFIF
ncbi:MAG: hypothetical protein A2Y64_06420 [Candidatus Coatesbacteria bacterium RBG_13_66_14]|uniref:Outer membrane protein beta-barrel domain-containing protein n=1 Tax=Candidatus Coatesbacteria bacterium RBG_13_66_14 TaxID=1817816 RepID=A0A1F5FB43_9BACT|nr:MAG: hypothetical protein A2Y64_06420 [Candidatus Coatesbacteria bacterium RBG_13_66_14]